MDTSVWIDHFRHGDAKLTALLMELQVLMHPFVIGEIALGNLRKRDEVLQLLSDLPMTTAMDEPEILSFIKRYELFGLGIGYVDAHILAAAQLNGARLWTRDKRLHEVAIKLGLD